ncbi:hypothetical protein KQX54_005047 [Cotesia glomerata]|uniref:Uncharacterized protein n=1 Tax=Cotesia glomerata TaxID=32391 RepID=A0AAV7IB62_COTGL|nr:hypothetical protein KQX54_005047 [Cotesia glomerata]
MRPYLGISSSGCCGWLGIGPRVTPPHNGFTRPSKAERERPGRENLRQRGTETANKAREERNLMARRPGRQRVKEAILISLCFPSEKSIVAGTNHGAEPLGGPQLVQVPRALVAPLRSRPTKKYSRAFAVDLAVLYTPGAPLARKLCRGPTPLSFCSASVPFERSHMIPAIILARLHFVSLVFGSTPTDPASFLRTL